MEIVSFQRLEDASATHIISSCEDTDTCPGCGAGYRAGMSACEYCRRPVRFHTGGMVPSDAIALIHIGEAIIPAMQDETFRH